MRAKLTSSVRALANGTATDDRPVLSGVLINKKEAVVSDGFFVVIKPLPAPEMDLEPAVDDGINEVIIPADALKACKGDEVFLETIETAKLNASEMDRITGSDKKIVARLNGADFNVEVDGIAEKYPDYKAMFNASPLVTQIAFNTKVLKKVLKTLPDDALLQMRISEPDKIVEIQCPDPDGGLPIRGIVTPMHASWLNVAWNIQDKKEATNTKDEPTDTAKKELKRCSTCGGFVNAQGFCKKCGK